MRIRLKKGKQREIINSLKKDFTWKELSKKFNLSQDYIRNELRNEKVTLSQEFYNILCNELQNNFDEFIIEKLDDNWGRSKGGINSPKNTKLIEEPRDTEELAELMGIILGDGHVEELKKSKKIRCYSIIIAGNANKDMEYLSEFIPSLFKKVFNEGGTLHILKNTGEGYFKIYGKNLVDFIKRKGISPGNKKRNNQGIPPWIKENEQYLRRCIRGLIDTDGSVHYISKKNLSPRIDYTSHIPNLLEDVRNGLVQLGFNPSKIIKNRHFFLSSRADINRYTREIGFSNQKNLNRLILIRNKMPL